MGKPLSVDLRSRLVAAVAGGLSRRAAGERFGVSAASAIRWVHASNTTGTLEAKPQGGDMRSHQIEVFGPVILAAIEAQKDISLVELTRLLLAAWRLVRGEHGVALPRPPRHDAQKKRRTQPSRNGPTSQPGARPGSQPSLTSIPRAWSSSTRPVRRPGWPDCAAAPCEASAAGRPSRTATGRRRRSPGRCAWAA